MFRYINMPKLVAFYLKEFSVRTDGTPSNLYKFIFCLCLPFVSNTFNTARMVALAIAECTQSRDQIFRLLNKITGATMVYDSYNVEFYAGYNGANDHVVTKLPYTGAPSFTDYPVVPYALQPNAGNITVTLNGFNQSQFNSYLSLLIPFYTNFNITYLP
jgi:hypothetical protein